MLYIFFLLIVIGNLYPMKRFFPSVQRRVFQQRQIKSVPLGAQTRAEAERIKQRIAEEQRAERLHHEKEALAYQHKMLGRDAQAPLVAPKKLFSEVSRLADVGIRRDPYGSRAENLPTFAAKRLEAYPECQATVTYALPSNTRYQISYKEAPQVYQVTSYEQKLPQVRSVKHLAPPKKVKPCLEYVSEPMRISRRVASE